MRFSTLSGAVLSAATVVTGKEMAKDEVKAARLYDSGKLHNQRMQYKMDLWLAEAEAGRLDSSQWPRLNYTKCINGKAEAVPGDPLQTFSCKNMDLYDFISHSALGSPNGWDEKGDGLLLTGSSSWGWTDPKSGREFVAIGQYDGISFVEVLRIGRLSPVAFLPCPAPLAYHSFWKELRGYGNYMLIGSELKDHGIQIFDMTKLLTIDASKGAKVLDSAKEVTSRITDLPLGRSHNVVAHPEAGYMVAVGAMPRTDTCKSGLIFYDMKNPEKPTRMGCNGDDGYVHDAQCVIYHGPDKRYVGKDICFGYNEDTLTIYDVTDKAKSTIISITSYEGASYTHQGWLFDDHHYLLMDDEYDEGGSEADPGAGPAKDGYPVTYIWDVSDLASPKQTGLYKGTVRAVDHNLYIHGDLVYQSSYCAGLRVYDVSSVPKNPTGDDVCEIAYFDIYPEDDSHVGGGQVEMYGSWSSYAFSKGSGFVFINTIERGGYLVKMNKRESCKPKGCSADNCLRAMRSTNIEGRLGESQKFCADFTDGWSADVAVVPEYASKACGDNVIARVSSACSCLPTATATAA